MINKKDYIVILSLLVVFVFTACKKSVHNEDKGVSIILTAAGTDIVNDISLWLFGTDKILKEEYNFESYKQMSSSLLPIPSGKYIAVLATNIKGAFSHNAEKGKTLLEDFLITINDPSSSPIHSHYDTIHLNVNEDLLTRDTLVAKRVMAEFKLTIKDIPADVASAYVKVLNTSKGYFPGLKKLDNSSVIVQYPEVIAKDGVLEFALKRMMPIAASVPTKADEIKTDLSILFKYANGVVSTINVSAPILQNGGSYKVNVEYKDLKSGIIIGSGDKNNWGELPPANGDAFEVNKN